MTTHARTFRATPARSAIETWKIIAETVLGRSSNAEAEAELKRIGGVMASVVSTEILRDHAIVLIGDGPRVKVYCVYDEDAITGDGAREGAIAHDPFSSGDWTLNIPATEEDKDWIERALKDAPHVVVRLPEDAVEQAETEAEANVEIDREAFLRS